MQVPSASMYSTRLSIRHHFIAVITIELTLISHFISVLDFRYRAIIYFCDEMA